MKAGSIGTATEGKLLNTGVKQVSFNLWIVRLRFECKFCNCTTYLEQLKLIRMLCRLVNIHFTTYLQCSIWTLLFYPKHFQMQRIKLRHSLFRCERITYFDVYNMADANSQINFYLNDSVYTLSMQLKFTEINANIPLTFLRQW